MNSIVNAGIARHVGQYSDAVKLVGANEILLVSGTPGIEADSGDLPASFEAQAELAWRNIVLILQAADMEVRHIVKLTQHLTRREDLAPYRDIRNRYLAGHAPASMLTFLPELVWPNMLIELEVVAAR